MNATKTLLKQIQRSMRKIYLLVGEEGNTEINDCKEVNDLCSDVEKLFNQCLDLGVSFSRLVKAVDGSKICELLEKEENTIEIIKISLYYGVLPALINKIHSKSKEKSVKSLFSGMNNFFENKEQVTFLCSYLIGLNSMKFNIKIKELEKKKKEKRKKKKKEEKTPGSEKEIEERKIIKEEVLNILEPKNNQKENSPKTPELKISISNQDSLDDLSYLDVDYPADSPTKEKSSDEELIEKGEEEKEENVKELKKEESVKELKEEKDESVKEKDIKKEITEKETPEEVEKETTNKNEKIDIKDIDVEALRVVVQAATETSKNLSPTDEEITKTIEKKEDETNKKELPKKVEDDVSERVKKRRILRNEIEEEVTSTFESIEEILTSEEKAIEENKDNVFDNNDLSEIEMIKRLEEQIRLLESKKSKEIRFKVVDKIPENKNYEKGHFIHGVLFSIKKKAIVNLPTFHDLKPKFLGFTKDYSSYGFEDFEKTRITNYCFRQWFFGREITKNVLQKHGYLGKDHLKKASFTKFSLKKLNYVLNKYQQRNQKMKEKIKGLKEQIEQLETKNKSFESVSQISTRGHSRVGSFISDTVSFSSQSSTSLDYNIDLETLNKQKQYEKKEELEPLQQTKHIKLTIKPIIPGKVNFEKLLKKQNKKCAGCNISIENRIFKKPRYCTYTDALYCANCHVKKTFFIPGRIIYFWDFKKYPVCNIAYNFLNQIMDHPNLFVSALNPRLFEEIKNLRKSRNVRKRLIIQWEIIKDCPFKNFLEKKILLKNKLIYIEDNTENYSLNDLIGLRSNNPKFLKEMIRIYKSFEMHITTKCSNCQKRAKKKCMVCNKEPIYAFDSNIITCTNPKCKMSFHLKCFKTSKGVFGCPICTNVS